jgi:hypothetical protein
MEKYKVKKFFNWGSLQLEPAQILLIEPSEIENALKVTQEATEEFIFVDKKALQMQLTIGNILKK